MPFRFVGATFTFATFPGLVAAATLQDTIADRAGVPLSFGGIDARSSEFEYGTITDPLSAAAVTLLPFLGCSAVAALLLSAAVLAVPFWTLGWWMCSWLGLAVAAHAFPDPNAALALRRTSLSAGGAAGRFGTALASAFRVSDALALVRIDLLYASLLYYAVASMLLPGSPGMGVPTLAP